VTGSAWVRALEKCSSVSYTMLPRLTTIPIDFLCPHITLPLVGVVVQVRSRSWMALYVSLVCSFLAVFDLPYTAFSSYKNNCAKFELSLACFVVI